MGVGELSEVEVEQIKRARARKEGAARPEMLPAERRGGWEVVEQALTEEAARREAARCLQCSVLCDKCVEVCPNRANYAYHVSPTRLSVPRLACRDGRLVEVGQEMFEVTQSRQIVHVDELCNECGNCATFCVHPGKPYLDKPRMSLEEFLVSW